jgi:VIT1/CCC1 family predicted Fe2+/Mn2+ transporter
MTLFLCKLAIKTVMEKLNNTSLKEPMSTQDWLVTYLILFFSSFIPLLPLIILLYWAFSDSTNLCKRNWAKGLLLFLLILFGLILFILLIYGASIAAMMNDMSNF